jgi:hypothetical protein
VLLGDVVPSTLLDTIGHRMQITGDEIDDVVEELAVEYRYQQLLFDAKRLSNAQGRAVSICNLVPTTPPIRGNLMASTTTFIHAQKIRMGLSPLVTWFNEHHCALSSSGSGGEQKKEQVSEYSRTPAVNAYPDVRSPRSALKQSNTQTSPLLTALPLDYGIPFLPCLDSNCCGPQRNCSQVSFSLQSTAADTDCEDKTYDSHLIITPSQLSLSETQCTTIIDAAATICPPRLQSQRFAIEVDLNPLPLQFHIIPHKFSNAFAKLKKKLCLIFPQTTRSPLKRRDF